MAFNPKLLANLRLPQAEELHFDLVRKHISTEYEVGEFLGRGSTSVVYSCRKRATPSAPNIGSRDNALSQDSAFPDVALSPSSTAESASLSSIAAVKKSDTRPELALKMFSKHKLDHTQTKKVRDCVLLWGVSLLSQ